MSVDDFKVNYCDKVIKNPYMTKFLRLGNFLKVSMSF